MNRVKFENTVLYLLHSCAPVRPGLTSLLKMVYLADFAHYRQFLSPITDAEYVALERGPVINGYKEVFEQMTKDRIVTLHEASILGRQEKKLEYRPVLEPDVSVFSPSELGVLDSVANQDGWKTGVDLSEKTHLEGPWQLVWDPREKGRPIPYPLFRWLDNLPDESDLAEANEHIEARPEIVERIAALQNSASN